MASSSPPLDDEDSPLVAPQTSSDRKQTSIDIEDDEQDDELLDYSQLTRLTAKSNNGLLPKRGEKDFERHGTKHQDNVLERSREAMHDALAYTRVHTGKSSVRGYWVGAEGADDETFGLGGDYCVVVDEPKGPHFKTMGKTKGQSTKGGGGQTLLWLLPEEALYLVERGNMDLWWPAEGGLERILQRGREEPLSHDEDEDRGTPMSLQAAYAVLIGRDGERGRVELDRYTVFANLRRTGYVVMRAPEWDASKPGARPEYELSRQDSPTDSGSIFAWLWGRIFAARTIEHSRHGPLVKVGLYRSYNHIYSQLAIIPRHKPAPVPLDPAPPPEAPFRVVFHLWKPTRIPTFAKSNPGVPDFRIAVVNARRTSVPTLQQITSLLESTPFTPPSAKMMGTGNNNLYARVRHGYRSVVVAVVDEGLTSYTRFGEGAFGEELIFEGFDRGLKGRGKGSGRGRGGGRGRGRGRGRGK